MFATSHDGARIYFEVTGDPRSQPLLMSHSLGTSLAMWNVQRPVLSKRFQVICFDTRGHGRSDAPNGPYSIEMLGRDALSVLQTVSTERKVHFVGLSNGGIIGMWLGVNAPEILDRLVVANTAAYFGTPKFWEERARLVRQDGMEGVVDSVVNRWLTQGFQIRYPHAVEALREMILKTPAEGYAACCEAIHDLDLRDAIRTLSTPTLVIAGRHDPATSVEQAKDIAARVSNSRLVILNTSHLSNIEAPDGFAKVLLDFLTRAD